MDAETTNLIRDILPYLGNDLIKVLFSFAVFLIILKFCHEPLFNMFRGMGNYICRVARFFYLIKVKSKRDRQKEKNRIIEVQDTTNKILIAITEEQKNTKSIIHQEFKRIDEKLEKVDCKVDRLAIIGDLTLRNKKKVVNEN